MRKPGRKSTEDLTVVPTAIPQRPEPPTDLPPEQADQWREIVAPMPADWFTTETQPLLRQLCQHIATSRAVARELYGFEGGCLKDPKLAATFERLAQRQEREVCKQAKNLELHHNGCRGLSPRSRKSVTTTSA
jgi:hypothetical protein